MSSITIRPVAAPDLPAVLEMIKGLAAHHDDTAAVTLSTLERDVMGAAPWLTVLVAEQGKVLLGYTALCPMAQLQFGVRGMDLHHLFVSPQARGLGLSKQLIDASIAAAKDQGCRYMTVGTHPDNVTAQGIYLAAGFEPLDGIGPRFRIKFD